MTPLHLSILIHYYCCLVEFTPRSNVRDEYTKDLEDMGLLEYAPEFAKDYGWRTTPKGRAWIEHVLNTPLPTQKWVWEDSK